jgi:hypothetical protein
MRFGNRVTGEYLKYDIGTAWLSLQTLLVLLLVLVINIYLFYAYVVYFLCFLDESFREYCSQDSEYDVSLNYVVQFQSILPVSLEPIFL